MYVDFLPSLGLFWTQTKIEYSLKQRVDSNAAFDMEQMQKSLDNTVNSQPRKSGGSSASNQQPRSKNHRADNGSSNLEVADQDSVQVMSNTTTPAKNGSNNKSEKKVINMTTVVKFSRAGNNPSVRKYWKIPFYPPNTDTGTLYR